MVLRFQQKHIFGCCWVSLIHFCIIELWSTWVALHFVSNVWLCMYIMFCSVLQCNSMHAVFIQQSELRLVRYKTYCHKRRLYLLSVLTNSDIAAKHQSLHLSVVPAGQHTLLSATNSGSDRLRRCCTTHRCDTASSLAGEPLWVAGALPVARSFPLGFSSFGQNTPDEGS